MYVRFPLLLRNVEDLLHERGRDVTHETIRFGSACCLPERSASVVSKSNWRWHLDEVFVRINGERRDLWLSVDHEGEVLEAFVTKKRDRRAPLRFLYKTMKRYNRSAMIVTDKLTLKPRASALTDRG
ncbi:DDE-type integrase/transposase/recombinase [Aestuariispira ectoiniformans]|uniref:DDE-type integrase/transposase/recombinase n=1 Tax=Aestuariispira ectoiniformans TaxID=2775080 RepID=UPI0035CD3030